MRHILSTALTALVVGAIAGVSASTLAQSQPATSSTSPSTSPSTYSPASVSDINADRVDGKHAVGAGAKIPQRAGKLVATDKHGFLPRNIVKPLWPLIQHMPAGFADGVDDGITGLTTTQIIGNAVTIAAGTSSTAGVTCPTDSHAIGGGFLAGSYLVFATESYQSGNGWMVLARNTAGVSTIIEATVICMSTDPLNALRTHNPVRTTVLLPRDK